MHYGEIKNYDIANGIGVRVSLFVSGCRNKCKNCFQPETWDFKYGRVFTRETWDEIFKMTEPEYKDISLKFRGSSNQRLIDMKLTKSEGEVVLWDENRG